ncbi:MAG: hypothetical protein GF411_01715 [Candidatus Lokiarchaeota archaeon]|nr:hypothetical protein [Candidatus Lokiarchaeota archaeon]
MRESSYISIMIVCVILLSPILTTSVTMEVGYLDNQHEGAINSVTRDVEFKLSKDYGFRNTITQQDFADRSADYIVQAIDNFVPNGIQKVQEVDLYYTSVDMTISTIHVIEDRDFGAGEVYFNLRMNDYDQRDYTYDNGGAFYSANDGDYINVDISISTYLQSMDGWFCIEAHGWESDIDYDDYMGGGKLWYNLKGYSSRLISGWWSLDTYSPDGGNNNLQLEMEIDIEFTDIEIQHYPQDFSTENDGSWLISAVYFPKVHYDTFDSADIVPIKEVYEQVYYGYDSSRGKNVYLIYYLFYWDYELDNFGLNFGHYYDYEPLLMFVENIGDEPYRIVYRDVGSHTLPPKLIIQDSFSSTESSTTSVEVSTELKPLLGDSCSVSYRKTNEYFDSSIYKYDTDHGLTPFMSVPHITITNTYHQMEVGVPLGSIDADVYPLKSYLLPMSDSVIGLGYERLDEAFSSTINVYEGVQLWNGGDYRVPEYMSLTYDMLHNPFEFPYIVDCWEDVAHYTEAKVDFKENGFFYDMDLGVTFTVPATVTLSVPSEVVLGESYEVGIDLSLDSNEIIVNFDYSIALQFILQWWFIDIDEIANFDGAMEFAVNLDEIADTLNALDFSGEDITGNYHEGWFTVTDFESSPNLLSTLLDCTVEIHMLRILKDLLGTTPVGMIVDLVDYLMDDVDIIANPKISGFMTANIETENSALSLDKSTLEFKEGTTHQEITMEVASTSTETTSGIRLANMQYHLNFATDWSVELDFSNLMNNFVSDNTIPIGTFPDITVSSDEHALEADTKTGYEDMIDLRIKAQAISTETTSQDGIIPGGDILGNQIVSIGITMGGIVVVIAGVVLIKRKTE